MSTGGFLQLKCRGIQDKYLTGNPQINMFKAVVKRYTAFAMESTENEFSGIQKTGQKLKCKIRRIGDMLHSLYLRVDLPKLQEVKGENDIYISWVNAIGYIMIEYVELQIGSKIIDRQYGQWMNIWSELRSSVSSLDALNTMVGKQNFFTVSSQNGPLQLYIPLDFWFCKDISQSLPLVALQHQDVFVNIKIKTFDLLWTSNNRVEAKKSLPFNEIEFDKFTLIAEYIFLDEPERRFFAKNSHMYLLEQIQFTNESIDINKTENVVKINFNHPVRELIWVFQSDVVREARQWTNYSTDVQTLLGESPRPPIKSALIRFDGVERFESRDEEYFRIVLPWQYHTRVSRNYIYIYSFSDKPELLQPTGTANFSRIDKVTLHLQMNDNISDTFISVYARSYNIFRIMNGISGVLFSN